ncbi:hypothetical protein GCM10011613_32360 [Cellvibrio zantedeschiae]|uniref:Uncharacterized protein n=1 Tax=Cellvibrio zantedeschiae TaxID=1237077 RepID=A0ABQ3BAA4_9GAMM|nr:hypothetical protein [Cellvibrio zantedeschiae]GGY84842.1 hypothetical protein GCM10011613_32360 [Cellvibrio zantedeschiae]
MSIIDPTRITAIFKTLSVTSSDGANTHKSTIEKKAGAAASLKIDNSQERDKEKLKKNLQTILKKLKEQDNFEEKAPKAVIKEILLWEFGDEFFNHPQFNRISQTVSEQMLTKKHSKDYFFRIVAELTTPD